MECGLKEKTILYFYGELGGKEMEDMRAHVEVCPVCALELETLRGVSSFLDSERAPSAAVQSAILKYSRGITIPSAGFSLLDKVYSLAFSLVLVLFFLAPFGKKETLPRNYELESGIASAEKSLSALKYELMDYSESNFEYRASDMDYSDFGSEVL